MCLDFAKDYFTNFGKVVLLEKFYNFDTVLYSKVAFQKCCLYWRLTCKRTKRAQVWLCSKFKWIFYCKYFPVYFFFQSSMTIFNQIVTLFWQTFVTNKIYTFEIRYWSQLLVFAETECIRFTKICAAGNVHWFSITSTLFSNENWCKSFFLNHCNPVPSKVLQEKLFLYNNLTLWYNSWRNWIKLIAVLFFSANTTFIVCIRKMKTFL